MDVQKVLRDKIVKYEGLTFDDVLLLPNYTDFKRKDVDLITRLHKKITLSLPVVSAPMDTVTEDKLATAMALHGGLGIIHRNLSVADQAGMVKKVKSAKISPTNSPAVDAKKRLLVGAAVGAGADLESRVAALVKSNADVIVVDSGHGHSKFIIDAVIHIKKTHPSVVVMAGNVATFDGAKTLIKVGVDILRVGMGPGSICTTRIISGMGVPQLTAVIEAVRATANSNTTVVADGGIQQIGDMAKALAFGAHAVMLGSLLSRFDESPGRTITIKGKKYKEYRGMGSTIAMKRGAAERYGQSKETDSKKLIAEGVVGLVLHKGKVSDFLYQIEGSLKTSLYYLGSINLKEFFQKARFIKTSNAGIKESHPHNITIADGGENYLK